jgi:hypothetical protein
MLFSLCDRCKTPGVQVFTVLGADLCNPCIADARAFLDTPITARRWNARFEQASAVCRARGTVDARLSAAATGEPYRRVYSAYMKLAKSGRLVHLGRGVFALPSQGAAG